MAAYAICRAESGGTRGLMFWKSGEGEDMKHFLIDKNYGDFLSAHGFSVEEILKKAALPEDLFARRDPSLTAEEYFRFMQAAEVLSPGEDTLVQLAAAENIESFSPPIFAAYCSRNALTCLKRLAQYKPLIGALLYRVKETENEVSVEIVAADGSPELPPVLVGMEFVFLVGLIRKAAKEKIVPVSAMAKEKMPGDAYAEFIGTKILQGGKNQLVFDRCDALLPFISRNESMWQFFEPELNRQLSVMDTDDSYAARVRSALMELLPSGECAIENVAAKLGYSKRSLQRKLQEENTSFQKQLNHVRELLAKHYVGDTGMRAEEIAYLLGYQDTSSFLRAFSVWTGSTVSGYRERAKR